MSGTDGENQCAPISIASTKSVGFDTIRAYLNLLSCDDKIQETTESPSYRLYLPS